MLPEGICYNGTIPFLQVQFLRGAIVVQSFFSNCKTNADSMLTGHIASFVLYCGSLVGFCVVDGRVSQWCG